MHDQPNHAVSFCGKQHPQIIIDTEVETKYSKKISLLPRQSSICETAVNMPDNNAQICQSVYNIFFYSYRYFN